MILLGMKATNPYLFQIRNLTSHKENSTSARFKVAVTRPKNSGSFSFMSYRVDDSCSSACIKESHA